MSDQEQQASPLWIWFAIVLFGGLGITMLMQGLGLHDARWFNPNPDVPKWVFALIGLLMLVVLPLLVNQLWPVSSRLVNLAGYSFFGVAWGLAHWLVFFAKGGSCSLEGLGFFIGVPIDLCTTIFGVLLGLFDLVFAGVAASALRLRLKT